MSVTDCESPRGGIRKGVCLVAAWLAAGVGIAAIAQASASASAPDRSEVAIAIPRKQDLASLPRGASFNERFAVATMAPLQVAAVAPDDAPAVETETTGSLPDRSGASEARPVVLVSTSEAIIGTASMYDPGDASDLDAGNHETASGEFYDANGWSAAIQLDLRDRFGGVRYGRNYLPTFALVETNDKRMIVRVNDVGPLKPGRIIDLNVRAMRYFDPTMQAGLIADVKVTPLLGTDYAMGPVTGAEPVTVASRDPDVVAP